MTATLSATRPSRPLLRIATAIRALAPVAASLVALALAGCGGPEGTAEDDAAPRERATVGEPGLPDAGAAPEEPEREDPPVEVPVPEAVLDRPEVTAETRAPEGAGERAPLPGGAVQPGDSALPPIVPPPVPIPEDPPRFPRPEHVRGIYLNAWAAGSARKLERLLDLARRTELNAFVIDLKDASGYVSHSTGVELAREAGAVNEIRIRDVSGLLHRLLREGIYPIARIVVVKDPVLVKARPDLAVQDTAGGVWVDGKGIRWLNPYDREVWDYHVALAREAARLGFPEIQWDYVRFPDAPLEELERATYPGAGGRSKPEAIRAFLEHSRAGLEDLDVVVTADVFGVTTSATDVGIGQVWEEFIGVVDVALPMVYPSHYWEGSFGIERPNAHPYEVVKRAVDDAVRRSEAVEGAGRVRPWLQDFSLGEPPYGSPEVRAQIQAVYDAGVTEWLLWNPSSDFTSAGLAPAGGFAQEPLMRVAGKVVPVSERFEALAAATAAERDSTEAVPAREVKPDTTGTRGARPDTTGSFIPP